MMKYVLVSRFTLVLILLTSCIASYGGVLAQAVHGEEYMCDNLRFDGDLVSLEHVCSMPEPAECVVYDSLDTKSNTVVVKDQNVPQSTTIVTDDQKEVKTHSKDEARKIRKNAKKQEQQIIENSSEQEIGSLEKQWQPVIFNHYVGVKGGYGMGLQRFEPTKESLMHLGLYNFGLIYMFDAVSKGNKYVGAVQIELEYLQKGFSYYTYKNSSKIYSRNYDVIQIPLLWQPYIPFGKNGSRVFLNAGPYVNYVLSSHEKLYDDQSGEVVYDRNYQWDAMRDNRAEYGIAAGLGFRVAVKRFLIGMEVRYHISFANLMKGMDQYVGNPFFATPVDQLNATLQLTYRLGK